MSEVACGWAGCGSNPEATLDGRQLCRSHFYDMATSRLEEYGARVQRAEPDAADRSAILKFLSEAISQTTTLVSVAKFLAPSQRDQFLELSLAAIELYKRIQRSPRILRNMPILIYRETDSVGSRELTNTVNVSKRGACIETSGLWQTGEKVWMEKPGNQLRTLVRIAWAKESEPSNFLIGLEILDCEDFWELELASPKKRHSRATTANKTEGQA
jgi:hypothetical protein